MLSLIQEGLKDRPKARKIKAISVFAKNVIIAAGVSTKREEASEFENLSYRNMERELNEYCQSNPSWAFEGGPGPGDYVVLIGDNGEDCTRGILLVVENSLESYIYNVYAYDRGEIRRVPLREIVCMEAKHRLMLPPRTKMVVVAGMVDYGEPTSSAEDADVSETSANVGALEVAHEWLTKQPICLLIHKSYSNEIIVIGEISAIKVYENGRKSVGEDYLKYMASQKLCSISDTTLLHDRGQEQTPCGGVQIDDRLYKALYPNAKKRVSQFKSTLANPSAYSKSKTSLA